MLFIQTLDNGIMKHQETKKALFIGINKYVEYPLGACVKDANDMMCSLNSNFASRLVENATASTIESEVQKLLIDRPSDHALLFYSGHGSFQSDRRGLLVGKDLVGVPMNWLVEQINKSIIPEITVILDCCHAGELGNFGDFDQPVAQLRKNVTILASTTEDDVAQEGQENGIFTKILLQGLSGAAADILGNITAAGLYDLADTMLSPWHQRPVFKSFVTRMSPLKKCASDVDRNVLIQLVSPDFFENPEKKMPLYPKHITTSLGRVQGVNFFSKLCLFHKLGLLECNYKMTVYEAALNSQSCWLSSYGLFIHEMIIRGRL